MPRKRTTCAQQRKEKSPTHQSGNNRKKHADSSIAHGFRAKKNAQMFMDFETPNVHEP